MRSLAIPAPAKINLTLKVLKKRPDGYHELETIMHKISLVDIIRLETAEKHIIINSNSSLIPADEKNLAYKAAALFLERTGVKAGVKIMVEKNIPVGAGLAGGSTDAAAVISGLNRLFDTGLSLAALQEMAAEIGSDVPFCLGGTTALARGRGELLTPLLKGPQLDLVLVVPGFQISTAEVYQNYKPHPQQQFDETAAFIKAWEGYNINDAARCLKNDLESVSARKFTVINSIKEELRGLGAINAIMSGSGPAVFGIFADQNQAAQAAGIIDGKYERVFQVTSYYGSD